jgi:hypothetical protein
MGKVPIPSSGVQKLASVWADYIAELPMGSRPFDLGSYLMEKKLGSQLLNWLLL